MTLQEEIFQYLESFCHSRTINTEPQVTKSIMIKMSNLPQTKECDSAARSQVKGYGKLVGGIDKKLSKSLVVARHS